MGLWLHLCGERFLIPIILPQVPGHFYVNDKLRDLVFEELQHHATRAGIGGFLPAVKQIANVAALPGIVHVRVVLTRLTLLAGFHEPLLCRMSRHVLLYSNIRVYSCCMGIMHMNCCVAMRPACYYPLPPFLLHLHRRLHWGDVVCNEEAINGP